ncbi:MAG: cyclic nucleotide-binding domain-containing protein [Acidimicrobiales bacterium]
MPATRHTAQAIAISWIPSEAVVGMSRVAFERGVVHYDPTPPDHLESPQHLMALRDADRFRFANALEAWVEVDDAGGISAWGQGGGGVLGSTTVGRGRRSATFAAVAYPDLRPEPEPGDGWVRFRQTAGGRTGVPAPRHVNRPPFVQLAAPTAWSTIELMIHADGRSEGRLVGSSPFPRHWLYDDGGDLVQKSGLIEFESWYRTAFGPHTPWGDVDHETRSGALESPLERHLSPQVMADDGVAIRRVAEGTDLIRQGESGDELYLLLDGIVSVAVDGVVLAELGPGAVIGERAQLAGRRTATVTALTLCRVAETSGAALPVEAITALAEEHRREEGGSRA